MRARGGGFWRPPRATPWRTLTSMGTALVLLFLLALAAIPGRPAAAAQPQRGQGRAVHRRAPDDRAVAGPAAGLRGVLQLLVHRHLRAAVRLAGRLPDPAADRARPQPAGHPVAAPRNLGRLPKHHTAEVAGEPDAVAAEVSERLRGWRRVTRNEDDTVEISAEKGYLREFGNIVFHFSLLGLLVAVAAASCSATRATSSSSPTADRASARRRPPHSTRSGRATPSTAPR